MRALLIVNTAAATVTPRAVSVIEHALASEAKVEMTLTKRQGHASYLAKGAVHEGVDLVVSLGGDGTVNEVANGLAGSHVPLGIIPGGGTNVMARSLGIPRDPIDATAYLLSNLRTPPRRVALGRAEGRHFTFACGMGLDGAIVREVERRQLRKKAVGQGYYVWSGLRLFFGGIDRRSPSVIVRWGPNLEHRRDGLFLAVCQKNDPFTYLGSRPMRICPDVRLEGGIDCLGLDRLTTSFVLRIVTEMFGSGRHVRNRHVLYLRDQERIEITAEEPLPVQMDGEYLGERRRLLLELVPDALSLVA
ncbi:MAG TPA: diacylglycerol kinase family protein [Actinomycetota bacterium]|nr:diacylglycerol kinase family protein [Actinomycetota bacterium]